MVILSSSKGIGLVTNDHTIFLPDIDIHVATVAFD